MAENILRNVPATARLVVADEHRGGPLVEEVHQFLNLYQEAGILHHLRELRAHYEEQWRQLRARIGIETQVMFEQDADASVNAMPANATASTKELIREIQVNLTTETFWHGCDNYIARGLHVASDLLTAYGSFKEAYENAEKVRDRIKEAKLKVKDIGTWVEGGLEARDAVKATQEGWSALKESVEDFREGRKLKTVDAAAEEYAKAEEELRQKLLDNLKDKIRTYALVPGDAKKDLEEYKKKFEQLKKDLKSRKGRVKVGGQLLWEIVQIKEVRGCLEARAEFNRAQSAEALAQLEEQLAWIFKIDLYCHVLYRRVNNALWSLDHYLPIVEAHVKKVAHACHGEQR